VAYFLFVKHHIKPSDYFNATIGEKIVYRAFAMKQAEDEEEAQADLEKELDNVGKTY
jgi:hypothetical protein